MISMTRHDPADACTCSYCGIIEDIHLLDGVLTSDGQDSGLLACIKCYPASGLYDKVKRFFGGSVKSGWCPPGYSLIRKSIAPSLAPLYREWLIAELAKAPHGSRNRTELLETLDAIAITTARSQRA
jgi:hypothetical protein